MKGSFKTALVAAVVSAFVAAGAAVATTKTFVLGTSNTVDAASTVTAGAAGLNAKMLQLTNNSTGSAATALGLTTPGSRPPLIVNSQAKVANLNADKLDGVESTQFQRVGLVYWGGPLQSAVGAVVIRWNELHAAIVVGPTADTVNIINICSAGSQALHVLSNSGPQVSIAPGVSVNYNVIDLRPFLIASADGVRSWMVTCSSDHLDPDPSAPRIRCQGLASNVG